MSKSELTQDEINSVNMIAQKKHLINELHKAYASFANIVTKMPIPKSTMLDQAFFQFDTGMLWMRELIQTAPELVDANEE